MLFALPAVDVGTPQHHKSLSVFPLFSKHRTPVEYRLADEALADESVTVTEVSESGSVPDLLVENQGDVRVLFLEGEELIGAKQNRILNTSVLVPAGCKLKVPVSCVERGRWRYRSHSFSHSGSHSSSKLRALLRESVRRSVKENRGHKSDQAAVWKEVESLQSTSGVCSSTAAMSDVYSSFEELIAEFHKRLPHVKDAIGMAVAIGDRIVMVDVFDNPATCARVWNRLLTGLVFDAMSAKPAEGQVTQTDVKQLLSRSETFNWERNDAVGEGEEYRCESDSGEHASALVLGEAVVHGSLVAASS